MLGYVFAQKVGKKVGDQITLYDRPFTVTGLYRTNISFGNSTVMLPLTTMQGENRLAGQVTLGFVKVAPGTQKKDVAARRSTTSSRNSTRSSRRRSTAGADRNLTLISAANTGGSILALVIAITGVLNTSLLSFFERIREFGVMRSVGWTRKRVLLLVLGETLVVSMAGAIAGLILGLGGRQRPPERRVAEGRLRSHLRRLGVRPRAGVRVRRGDPRSPVSRDPRRLPGTDGGAAPRVTGASD